MKKVQFADFRPFSLHNRNITGSALARRSGISRQAVHQARRRGRIESVGVNSRGWPLFDETAAMESLNGKRRQPRHLRFGGRPKSGLVSDKVFRQFLSEMEDFLNGNIPQLP